ncbi:hypothetical protein DSECCO2_546010 [anaerobic digester metagenome]
MKCEKPMPLDVAQSSTDVNSESDCERKATLPGSASRGARLAFTPTDGVMNPRQLGPSTRTPQRCAACNRAAFCTSRRSRSNRKNPRLMITAARVPRLPSSSM